MLSRALLLNKKKCIQEVFMNIYEGTEGVLGRVGGRKWREILRCTPREWERAVLGPSMLQ